MVRVPFDILFKCLMCTYSVACHHPRPPLRQVSALHPLIDGIIPLLRIPLLRSSAAFLVANRRSIYRSGRWMQQQSQNPRAVTYMGRRGLVRYAQLLSVGQRKPDDETWLLRFSRVPL